MPRFVYVTAHDGRDLYENLSAEFSGNDDVEVIPGPSSNGATAGARRPCRGEKAPCRQARPSRFRPRVAVGRFIHREPRRPARVCVTSSAFNPAGLNCGRALPT